MEDALFAAPVHLARPARQSVPFLFASPHSGRRYPAAFLAASRLDPSALRRSEDAYVDELFACVPELGAPLLAACFPRAYLDVNRGSGELDRTMFDGPLPVPADAPGPRVTAGLGVIPRIVRDGAGIYRGKLPGHEAQRRLTGLYVPYHRALKALIAETKARFGAAIVIDCHSMPSALSVPDVVLGDRYGASAGAGLTAWAEDAFAGAGFSVARNTPYAGGHTTVRYGRIEANCHVLQVEINRALYMDEESVTKSARFPLLRARLEKVLAELTAMPLSGLGPALASAAE